jgi:hypothetical protein
MIDDEDCPATMASDVYAFEMFLYELCTCEKRFAREGVWNSGQFVRMIVQGRRSKVPRSIPARIAALMQRCWRPHPNERPTFRQIVTEMSEEDFVWDDTALTEYGNYRAMILSALRDPPP